jgi:hypothetical protein
MDARVNDVIDLHINEDSMDVRDKVLLAIKSYNVGDDNGIEY